MGRGERSFICGDGAGSVHIRHGEADYLAARGGKGAYLPQRGLHVLRLGAAHGLNGNGGAASHGDASDNYPLCFLSGGHFISLAISLYMTKAERPSSSTMPAAWT